MRGNLHYRLHSLLCIVYFSLTYDDDDDDECQSKSKFKVTSCVRHKIGHLRSNLF